MLGACVNLGVGPASRFPVQWSPALGLDTLEHLDERLARTWEFPLEVSRLQGSTGLQREFAKIENCLSYFQLTRQGFQSTPLKHQMLEGVVCHALQALKHAVPARRSFLAEFTVNDASVRKLPPDLALSISPDDQRRVQRAKTDHLSWDNIDTIHRVIPHAEGSGLVEGDGWAMRLTILARGDFNQDGFEDLLLQTHGWLTEGTYERVRLLELTRKTPQGPLTVTKEYSLTG